MTRHDPAARPPARNAAKALRAKDESVPVAELSYTEASRELDAIVEFFEQREVDVDQLVARLERATAIVDELDRRLRQTRMQVEELVPRLESAARDVTTPAPVEGDDDAEEDDEGEEDFEEDLEVWAAESGNDDSDRPLF